MQSLDGQCVKMIRLEDEIDIGAGSRQRVHGGERRDIRGPMQTHDPVVSDKPRVRKIKPLIAADLHGTGEGLRECRHHLASSIGPAHPQVAAKQDTEHDEAGDRGYDPLANEATLHGLHGLSGNERGTRILDVMC